MKGSTLPVLATVLAGAVASPDPGILGDIQSAWGGVTSDVSAEASTIRDDWSSALASATATSTSPSSSASASSTSASLAQNISSLTYPRCSSSDGSRAWCGIVIGANGQDNSSNTFNVSITDSKCKQVALQQEIEEGDMQSFSSSVGNWTFGVTQSGSLNMTYNGRNISDYRTQWDSWALEEYDTSTDTLVMYGGLTNCTSADEETSSAARSRGLTASGAGALLAAVAIGVMSML